MISTNAYFRTFFVKAGGYGTAFTVDVEGDEYLVTARHLIADATTPLRIEIFFSQKWLSTTANLVGLGKGDVDIAVLRLPVRLTAPEFRMTLAVGDFFPGQDVYFLGFPYKMWGDMGEIFQGRPCAFAKKGTISFVSTGHTREFYVDAINNEGFSGGPLFHHPPADPNDIRVLGVVSKFRVEHEPVLTEDGKETKLQVAYNTGFLVAYGSKHVLDIIAAARGA